MSYDLTEYHLIPAWRNSHHRFYLEKIVPDKCVIYIIQAWGFQNRQVSH